MVVYERAGQVRSEHTAAPMMQLLSDVDHDTPQPECPVRRDHNRVRRSSQALIATTMVLIDISTAPTVESSTIPHATGTPAASGPPTLLAMRWRTRADQPCAAIIDGRTAGLESRRQHINGLRLWVLHLADVLPKVVDELLELRLHVVRVMPGIVIAKLSRHRRSPSQSASCNRIAYDPKPPDASFFRFEPAPPAT